MEFSPLASDRFELVGRTSKAFPDIPGESGCCDDITDTKAEAHVQGIYLIVTFVGEVMK